MNRAELRSEIQSRADDTNSAVSKPDQVNRWINLGVRYIWRKWPWTFTTDRENVDTVAGEPLVLLPAGMNRPKRVVNTTTGRILIPEVERILQKWWPDVTAVSEPFNYCDGGLLQASMDEAPQRQMRLYPTPDVTYTLEVTALRSAPTMSKDTNISPLPEEFDEAIILWSLVRYYRKIEDLMQASEHKNAFDEEINGLFEDFSVWQVDQLPKLHDESDW